jgi:uncharacterized protein YutE (UPF0331/DUF86 family)
MVRVELIREKIRRLRDTADALRKSLPSDAQPLRSERDARDLVAFRVYLVVQEAIDLCSHVIADQGWGPVPSLRDHFLVLASKGILPSTLAQELAASIKVRNLIGHAYTEIDPDKLHAAATTLLALVDPFCAAVLVFAEANAS